MFSNKLYKIFVWYEGEIGYWLLVLIFFDENYEKICLKLCQFNCRTS